MKTPLSFSVAVAALIGLFAGGLNSGLCQPANAAGAFPQNPDSRASQDYIEIVGTGQDATPAGAATKAEADAYIQLQALEDANPDKLIVVVSEGITKLEPNSSGYYAEYTIIALMI